MRDTQNPFGEILGYYQVEMDVPVIEVTAITHRRDGIVEDFWPGHMDHWNLGSIPKEGSVYNVIKKNVPGIKAIHLPPSGADAASATSRSKKNSRTSPTKPACRRSSRCPT